MNSPTSMIHLGAYLKDRCLRWADGTAVIPPELYRTIVEHVDRKSDLYNLLLVSHQFRLEAERCLYTNVTLDLGSERGVKEVCEMFMNVMLNPRLAAYIHSLNLGRADYYPVVTQTNYTHADWVKFIRVGVSGLPNLRRLVLPLMYHSLTYPSPAAPFRLHSLACGGGVFNPFSISNPSDAREFFLSQPDIHELDFPFKLNELDSDVFPNLERLQCSEFQVLQDLLPGRSIKRVTLERIYNFTDDIPEQVLGASGLAELDIDVFDCLKPFGECFGTLERLTICVSVVDEFESLKTILLDMQRLKDLHISTFHILSGHGFRGPVSVSAFRALNKLVSGSESAIRAACPSLESSGLTIFFGKAEGGSAKSEDEEDE